MALEFHDEFAPSDLLGVFYGDGEYGYGNGEGDNQPVGEGIMDMIFGDGSGYWRRRENPHQGN